MNEFQQRMLNYLLSQTWAINLQFGLQQFNQFMMESEANADWLKDTLVERRKSLAPKIMNSDGELPVNGSLLTSDIKPNSILKLSLGGTMTVEDQLCSNNGIRRLTNQLYDAYQNKNIIGVILETTSGGGEELAGIMLDAAIESKNKPVIQYIHQSGSAAVRGGLSANERWASTPSSMIGSIGVYLTIQKGFTKWYNENYQDIYAKQSTDKNKAFREFLQGNTEPLQLVVDEAAKKFQEAVKSKLQLRGDKATVNETVSGAMFYAQDAKNRGLIDGVGNMNKVISRIKSYY